jgi:hypothetical protein
MGEGPVSGSGLTESSDRERHERAAVWPMPGVPRPQTAPLRFVLVTIRFYPYSCAHVGHICSGAGSSRRVIR